MVKVPIVFAFNRWILKESIICIESLLKNALPETFYSVFVVHGKEDLNRGEQKELLCLNDFYTNCTINFVPIDESMFNDVHIARGVPKVTYYRFLLPSLFKEYEKIIFSDPDIIYTGDLSSVFVTTDLGNNYLAAVKSAYVKEDYVLSIGCDPDTYTNGGFQIYNLDAFRKNELEREQLKLINRKYFYLDQDITNIVCKGKIVYLSPRYNSTNSFFVVSNVLSMQQRFKRIYSAEEILEGLSPVVYHFNGVKPWKGICHRQDVYWEAYRSSKFFNESIYYTYYDSLLNPSPLTLTRRLPKAILKSVYIKFKELKSRLTDRL